MHANDLVKQILGLKGVVISEVLNWTPTLGQPGGPPKQCAFVFLTGQATRWRVSD